VAATALAVSLVVLTFSRSTWLATGVACALIVGLIALGDRSAHPSFGVRGNALKLTAALALVALVALYIGAAAGSTTMWDRVLNPLGDESVTDRLDTNANALEAIAASPLRGTGLGNWRAAIENQEDVAYIHNVFLEYSVAVGIFGGLWALMVVTVPLAAGAALIRNGPGRDERLLGVVILAVFLFAAVHFMFDDNLLNPQYAWLLSFMFGGSIAAAWAGRSYVAAGRTGVGS
jgi:O-antigen ligase